jgi:hypothetical protein
VHFEGILCGDDKERVGKRVRLRVDRNLAFAHCLQQGALGPGVAPVDLVGEHDVRKERPGGKGEAPFVRVVDVDADHILGEQVARELDAAKCPGNAC